jgi:hypothetical protein
MLLFPLLPHRFAVQIAQDARGSPVASLAKVAANKHPATEYTPTGGHRITPEILDELRKALLQLAQSAGYPASPTQVQAAAFDAGATMLLMERIKIAPAEAAKGGLWEFISCVLLPDLVRWRFGGTQGVTSFDRFFSGRRNTFQRLWWRSYHLSSGHNPTNADLHKILHALGEDELVQLMERPSIAGIQGLTYAISQGLLRASVQHKDQLNRRELIREAQKRFLRLSSFLLLESVSPDELNSQVQNVFEQVAASLKK